MYILYILITRCCPFQEDPSFLNLGRFFLRCYRKHHSGGMDEYHGCKCYRASYGGHQYQHLGGGRYGERWKLL